MHAFLLIGKNTLEAERRTISKLNGPSFEFPISKIEEVRQLSAFLRNTQSENTVIVAHNIDEATTEALNAFLKSLEEPQKNVSFILTAKNEYKVLPTIVSRCQLIRVKDKRVKDKSEEVEKFIGGPTGNKFEIIDKIKGRPEAVEFVQNLVTELHSSLNSNKSEFSLKADSLEKSQSTLNSLNANGNVGLQLTNLIVNLDAG